MPLPALASAAAWLSVCHLVGLCVWLCGTHYILHLILLWTCLKGPSGETPRKHARSPQLSHPLGIHGSQACRRRCPRQSGWPQWASTTVSPAAVGVHDSQASCSGHPRQSGWLQWVSMTVRPAAVGVQDNQAGRSGRPWQAGQRRVTRF